MFAVGLQGYGIAELEDGEVKAFYKPYEVFNIKAYFERTGPEGPSDVDIPLHTCTEEEIKKLWSPEGVDFWA